MDVIGGLALVVSLLLGVLLALLIDGYALGRRLQVAVSQNRQLQQKLRRLATRLVSTQEKLRATQAQALTVMLNDEAHEPAIADSQPATCHSQTAQ